jgi:hypothetical protein
MWQKFYLTLLCVCLQESHLFRTIVTQKFQNKILRRIFSHPCLWVSMTLLAGLSHSNYLKFLFYIAITSNSPTQHMQALQIEIVIQTSVFGISPLRWTNSNRYISLQYRETDEGRNFLHAASFCFVNSLILTTIDRNAKQRDIKDMYIEKNTLISRKNS